jgi:hypothetical protein
VLLRLRIDPGPGLGDDWLVEIAKADLARAIGDCRVASFERRQQPVERLAEVVPDVTGELIGLFVAPVEDREDCITARSPGRLSGPSPAKTSTA